MTAYVKNNKIYLPERIANQIKEDKIAIMLVEKGKITLDFKDQVFQE